MNGRLAARIHSQELGRFSGDASRDVWQEGRVATVLLRDSALVHRSLRRRRLLAILALIVALEIDHLGALPHHQSPDLCLLNLLVFLVVARCYASKFG